MVPIQESKMSCIYVLRYHVYMCWGIMYICFEVSVSPIFRLDFGTGFFFFILSLQSKSWNFDFVRDRPFNLEGGGGGGGYGFLFRSEFFFWTTPKLEYLFFLLRPARNFFPEFNIRLYYMTKTLNHVIFVFLHQNQNIFFSNIGNQNIFLRIKWSVHYQWQKSLKAL